MARAHRFIPADRWRDPRHVRGLRGEHAAMAYLIACGWEVEAHRFRLGRHDVDLVVRRGSLVAFVEVKTRRSVACGAPEESVGPPKQRSVAKAAELWRLRRGRPDDTYRFDVVAVRERERGAVDVEHIADAWRLDRTGGECAK